MIICVHEVLTHKFIDHTTYKIVKTLKAGMLCTLVISSCIQDETEKQMYLPGSRIKDKITVTGSHERMISQYWCD